MPLYTVVTQAGVLGAQAKAKLAGELTGFHSEYSGVAKNWVHIVTGKWIHGRRGGCNSGTHTSYTNWPVAGI
jgi:hypothetical protein